MIVCSSQRDGRIDSSPKSGSRERLFGALPWLTKLVPAIAGLVPLGGVGVGIAYNVEDFRNSLGAVDLSPSTSPGG